MKYLIVVVVVLVLLCFPSNTYPQDPEHNYELVDSLLKMTPAERNKLDPDSNYVLVYTILRGENGKYTNIVPDFIKEEKSPTETGPWEFIDNQLENLWLTTLWTILYITLLAWLLKKKSKLPWSKFLKYSWLIFAIIGVITWPMFSSIIFNTNELITRETGKQYRAHVTYESKTQKIKSRTVKPYDVINYYPFFNCYRTEEDSIYRIIQANRTTFKAWEVFQEDITVCLDARGKRAAVLIPWHIRSNIMWISICCVVLIVLMMMIKRYVSIIDVK